ncbi:Autophagy-related protein 17 [Meyerozyma sp. JA9]|nr:Autophagy-related protein 17 [Meyerozyma sp. JA9]
MITRDQVLQWASEASVTLTRAQEVCQVAQNYLQETDFELHDRLATAIDTSHDMVSALQEQSKVMEQIVKVVSVQKMDDDGIELKVTNFQQQSARLKRNVSVLESTVVPNYLLRQVPNTNGSIIDGDKENGNKTLKDFISLTSIELLEDNAQTYVKNSSAIRKWRTKAIIDIIGRANLYKKQASRLASQYENEATGIIVETSVGIRTEGSAFASRSLAETIDKENKSLETELVSLLESLTNHYDQCNRALGLPWSNEEALAVHHEGLQVLEGDARDLPGVYKEVCTVQEIIENNRNRAAKYLSSKLPPFEKIVHGSRNLLDTIREFKCRTVPQSFATIARTNELLQSYVINGETISSGDPLESYIMAISDLCDHYEQFAHIYAENYLAELRYRVNDYPQSFIAKISDFLNGELDDFRRKETQRRAQWVKQYGEYIPNEFILPDEVPSVVQVITNIDDIETADMADNHKASEGTLDRNRGSPNPG